MIGRLILMLAITLTASIAYGSDTDRASNMLIINELLENTEISDALVAKGKDPDLLHAKISTLSDWQLARVSAGTQAIILNADSTGENSAERISTQWLNLVNRWLMIGAIGVVLLFVLIL